MSFLLEQCTLRRLDEEVIRNCEPFDCNNADLNEFFSLDFIEYNKELLGRTYCFTLDSNPKEIVCAFSVSNDSIKTTYLPNSRKTKVNKDIPRVKQSKSYPAVLIGRLGVSNKHRKKGVGKDLMNHIKGWFIHKDNKTGCRYVVVDSYNEIEPIKYYKNNNFEFLFSSEDQERKYFDYPLDSKLKTRLMYFDLLLLASSHNS